MEKIAFFYTFFSFLPPLYIRAFLKMLTKLTIFVTFCHFYFLIKNAKKWHLFWFMYRKYPKNSYSKYGIRFVLTALFKKLKGKIIDNPLTHIPWDCRLGNGDFWFWIVPCRQGFQVNVRNAMINYIILPNTYLLGFNIYLLEFL